MNVGLRVDVDCIADALAIPQLLDILKKYDSKATFFIATGPDDTLRNAFHYTGKRIFKIPLKRFFSGMGQCILKKHVESNRNLKLLLDEGYEIGLHGYMHYEWMNFLNVKSKEDISDMISRGCDLFEHEFGSLPRSFASPGFKISDQFLRVLDDFGFDYSSDFLGDRIFYPIVNNNTLNTAQVPISMPSLCELPEDENKILGRVKKLCSGKYSVFYIHPSCEPIFRKNLFQNILSYAGGTKTLSEIYENSSDI
jgi:peptidoglycan/xylan/chitin deacetylase (PgdA/CDA1 family)